MRQPHLATRWIKRVALVAIALAVALTLFIPSQANAAPAPARPVPARRAGAANRRTIAQPNPYASSRRASNRSVPKDTTTACNGAIRFRLLPAAAAYPSRPWRVNRIPNPHRIYAGQTLLIPATHHHWR